MNVDAVEVVYVVMLQKELKDATEADEESEAEDEVTTSINYLFHMVMGILLLKLRYMIKVNINHFLDINKLQFMNSKVWLV